MTSAVRSLAGNGGLTSIRSNDLSAFGRAVEQTGNLANFELPGNGIEPVPPTFRIVV